MFIKDLFPKDHQRYLSLPLLGNTLDETSKQFIRETRTPITASPGESLRYDAEYERPVKSPRLAFK